MRREEVLRLIRRFRDQRTVFHTYHDHFAFQLLAWAAGDGARIADLKRGAYACLLQIPSVRERLGDLGRPEVDAESLMGFWPEDHQSYMQDLTVWPQDPADEGWQMGRGPANLVLLLCLPESADRGELRFLDPDFRESLRGGHFGTDRREVFSWARIDLQSTRHEALIEEVQSDWASRASRHHHDHPRLRPGLARYLDGIVRRRTRQWSETTVLATLRFLRDEFAIRTVWYYGFAVGNALKGMEDWHPRGRSTPACRVASASPRWRMVRTGW